MFNRAIVLTDSILVADCNAYSPSGDEKQIVLCRAALGRSLPMEDSGERHVDSGRLARVAKHSEPRGEDWAVLSASQILPEYIITYKSMTTPRRCTRVPRNDLAFPSPQRPSLAKNGTSVSQASPSKMCLICMTNEVSHVSLPCGHISFCGHCVAEKHRLDSKCPECREHIHSTMRLNARVAAD